MPERERERERRQATSSSSTTRRVRRNLFPQHLTQRPTTSSTSTSAETLRLDIDHESDSSNIVIRDKNGEIEIEELSVQASDEPDEGGDEAGEDEKERQRLVDAVRHHQRDRNRAPSEPAELLDAVRASLRAKVNALAADNWMYEAEEEAAIR